MTIRKKLWNQKIWKISKGRTESLARASHRISEVLYSQAGGAQAGPQGQAGGNYQAGGQEADSGRGDGRGEVEVIDAEVVDEDKKN